MYSSDLILGCEAKNYTKETMIKNVHQHILNSMEYNDNINKYLDELCYNDPSVYSSSSRIYAALILARLFASTMIFCINEMNYYTRYALNEKDEPIFTDLFTAQILAAKIYKNFNSIHSFFDHFDFLFMEAYRIKNYEKTNKIVTLCALFTLHTDGKPTELFRIDREYIRFVYDDGRFAQEGSYSSMPGYHYIKSNGDGYLYDYRINKYQYPTLKDTAICMEEQSSNYQGLTAWDYA